MSRSTHSVLRRIRLAVLATFGMLIVQIAGADIAVYGDQLHASWDDWSWATHSLSSSSPVHSGNASMSMEPDSWQALFLHSAAPFTPSQITAVEFWIHGGASGGQQVSFAFVSGGSSQHAVAVNSHVEGGAVAAGQWRKVTINLAAVGYTTGSFDGIWWQDATGGNQGQLFIDDVVLIESNAPPTAIEVTIDVGQNRNPINPDIYGMNFCSEAMANELKVTVNRWGGNSTTRYNWQHDISNRANDWFYMNIENDLTPAEVAELPGSASSNKFIEANNRAGAETLLTIPMIGWTPIDRTRRWGFSVAKYGTQQNNEFLQTGGAFWANPDAGNGVLTNGTNVTGNDPTDTSIAIGPEFVTSWINHLKGRYGTADTTSGVRYYNLDNEADLWHSTHRDVHPNSLTYDELRDLTYAYASVIKQADPAAKTLGPVSWGWNGYFSSPVDWWPATPTDRPAHGNMELVAWYLDQMRQYELTTGTRILDYLDLHFYPQGAGVYDGNTDLNTRALRLRQTRGLWDTTYIDESWIGQSEGAAVYLIPRMHAWVNTYYPGTKLAISEYSFGAPGHINGAVAQADALGIFGRERVDMATIWTAPDSSDPQAFAFRMFRNYDGAGSRFGETGVSAVSSDQEQLAVYASQRTGSGIAGVSTPDGALVAVIVNKAFEDISTTITLAEPPATGGRNNGPLFAPAPTAKVYRYSDANLGAVVAQPDAAVSATGGGASTIGPLTFPAQSITTLVVPSTVEIPVELSRWGLE